VKKAARVIIEKYYSRMTDDFKVNNKICEEVAVIPSKRMRNKIAGFATHLMKRIAKGPVKGISLKMQEEERERKDNYVPDVSAIEQDEILVDAETKAMLRNMEMGNMPRVVVADLPNGDPRNERRPFFNRN
jgi:small subunit ribosomal protein S17e